MRLQSLIITFIQVAVVESITEVFGYHGGNVTLPSGANSSWTLTKIEWSIYTNNTWIATYQRNKTNVNRLHSYKGRLHLNTSSGNLTICDLKETDAMEYSVDLIDTKGHDSSHKIRLILRKQLQKPIIQTVNSNLANGVCWVELNCSSTDEGVNLSWHFENSSVTSSIRGSVGSSAVLFALANTKTTKNQDHHHQKQVKFTCNSRKDGKTASADSTLTCESKKEPPPPKWTHTGLVLVIGVFLGVLATLAFIYREKIKKKCEEAKEKVFPKKT